MLKPSSTTIASESEGDALFMARAHGACGAGPETSGQD